MRAALIAILFLSRLEAAGQSTFALPLRALSVTSGFGPRLHPVTGRADNHKGVDLQARAEPVFAILPGRVSACGYQLILGNYIRIDHGGLESIYGHLSLILVKKEQELPSGHLIGITGDTGRVTGEHLHFGICYRRSYINPLRFLFSLSVAEPP